MLSFYHAGATAQLPSHTHNFSVSSGRQIVDVCMDLSSAPYSRPRSIRLVHPRSCYLPLYETVDVGAGHTILSCFAVAVLRQILNISRSVSIV